MTPTEINRRIAEIIGDDDRHEWERGGDTSEASFHVCRRCGDTHVYEFDEPPERGCVRDFWGDERAAIWAAEKTGLFDGFVWPIHQEPPFKSYKCQLLLARNNGKWEIRYDDHGGPFTTDIQADTLRAAICQAILTLKDKQ